MPLEILMPLTFIFTCAAGKDLKDFYEQIPIMIRELTYRFNCDNMEVLNAAHKACTALSKHAPAEELVNHVEFMRNLIASMVSDARRRRVFASWLQHSKRYDIGRVVVSCVGKMRKYI
jgi:hypothetical protein